jgi:hypothetical protein
MKQMIHGTIVLALGALLGQALPAAAAVDYSLSGYATLGWTRSTGLDGGSYLRFSDENGSLKTDSRLAGQLDVRFTPAWSATLQLKLAPAADSDQGTALTTAWAFVGWRPGNEWLLRAGRMRLPLYLQSESLDVGVAYDMARLPVEMYSVVPSNEFDGLSVAYTLPLALFGGSELSIDGYGGRFGSTARLWNRDGAPPALPAGANFRDVDVRLFGAVLSLRNADTTLRLSVNDARTRPTDGNLLPVSVPFVQIAPGLGYFRVSEELPGPPIETVERLHNIVTTLGVDHQFGGGWRATAEIARNRQFRTNVGANTTGGYVALAREIGDFTPYLSYGRLSTHGTQMDMYRRLLAVQLPGFIPGAAQINASQRVFAESIYAAEQHTWSLGTSWNTPWGGKLKLEWARTRVGEVSRLLDTPPGQHGLRDASFSTTTINYNLAF